MFKASERHCQTAVRPKLVLPAPTHRDRFLDTSSRPRDPNPYVPSTIHELVVLGDSSVAASREKLSALDISVVLSCGFEFEHRAELPHFPGVDYFCLPVADTLDFPIQEHVLRGVAIIARAVAAGQKIYIHCARGVSRSATVVIAWVMAAASCSYQYAFRYVQHRRPCVAPNLGFVLVLHQLEEFLSALRQRRECRCVASSDAKYRSLHKENQVPSPLDGIPFATSPPTMLGIPSSSCPSERSSLSRSQLERFLDDSSTVKLCPSTLCSPEGTHAAVQGLSPQTSCTIPTIEETPPSTQSDVPLIGTRSAPPYFVAPHALGSMDTPVPSSGPDTPDGASTGSPMHLSRDMSLESDRVSVSELECLFQRTACSLCGGAEDAEHSMVAIPRSAEHSMVGISPSSEPPCKEAPERGATPVVPSSPSSQL